MLELKHIRKTIGLKQTVRLIESDDAQQVIIANDADDKVVLTVRTLCSEKGIEVISAESMKILGKACHIDVGAAVVGIMKDEDVAKNEEQAADDALILPTSRYQR